MISREGLCSIVIPVYNQLDYTRQCLDSLCDWTRPAYELIVVDNGSGDGTAEYLRDLAPRNCSCTDLVVISNRANLGVPRAWNQGVAAARGGIVCIMNNDVVVTPGWLDGLISYLEEHPDVGIAGPHVLWGEDQLPADLAGFARGYVAENSYKEDDGFWGCCFLVTRRALELLGPFDEGYEGGYWEDADYRMRAAAIGCRAVVTHRSVVYHHVGVTWQNIGVDRSQEIYWRNARRFAEKWNVPLGNFMVWRSNFIPLD